MKWLDQIWVQNLCLLVGYTLLARLIFWGMRSERWQSAWGYLRRDKVGMLSLWVVLFYLLVGTLESISIPGSSGSVTVLQRLTQRQAA